MKRWILLIFVKEMSHDYESLLNDAVDDIDTNGKHEEADLTALLMANQAIAESLRNSNQDKEAEKEDYEEDEEDNEAEYYRWWKREMYELSQIEILIANIARTALSYLYPVICLANR